MSRRASESIALTGPTATAQDDKPKSRRSAQSVALTGDGGALSNMPPSAPVPPERQTVADGTASAVDTGYSSFLDYIGDMGSRAKIGLTRGLQAIPQIPVGVWNTAVSVTPAKLLADALPDNSGIGQAMRGAYASALLDQPELVREFADTGDRLIAGTQDRMSVTAAAQRDADEKTQGVIDTAKLYLSNPSMIQGAAIESLAQSAVTAGVPGGVGGQLAAQGAMAGAAADRETQNAIRAMTPERVSQFEDVAKYAELHGMTPEEAVAAIARERGAQAFAGSAVLNAMLPKVIPGGTAVERAVARAGGADVLPTQAGRFTNLLVGGVGEAGGEAIAEGGEKFQQNVLTDVRDPRTGQQTPFAGVGKAATIGGLTGAAMGTVTGATEGGPEDKINKGGTDQGDDADATAINPPDDPALDPISTADITASASAELARIEGLGDKASAEEKQVADFLRANKKKPNVLARAAGYRLDDTEANAKAAAAAAQAEQSAGEAMRVERAKSEALNVQAAQQGGQAAAAGASPVASAPAQSAPDLTARFDSVRGKTRPELVAAVMAAATPDARADAAANIAAFDALRAKEAADAQKSEQAAAKAKPPVPVAAPLIQPTATTVGNAPATEQGNASVTMQNRNRDRVASVLQMQGIANNPDAQRLSVSRDPSTGAPMVYIGGDSSPDIAEADFGASDVVTMANGRKVPFRYAVVDADSVQASNFADGSANPDYALPLQKGQIRALNNGRTAGLQAAFARGSAAAYVEGITADAAAHGVSASAIAGKRRPMLVRVYSEADNTGDMGAESNASAALGLSASEQAATDARALPSLDMLRVGEDGDVLGAGNRDFVRAWLQALGQNEAARMASANGEPTRQMSDRLKAALFHAAYGADRLTSAMAEDASPEMRNVIAALTIAAPKFAALDKAGPFGDVASVVADAIELIRDSKARGIAIGSVSDMFSPRAGAVDELARRIDSRSRAPRKLGELLAELARFVSAEQAAAQTTDMFGKPVVTYDDAINAWDRLNEQQNADANANAGQSAGLFDANGRAATVGGGAPAPGAVQPADNVGGAGSNRVENGRDGQPVAQRREPEQTASGIPAGLRAEQTDESRRLAKRFNGWLERLGRGAEQVRFREVTASSLPDALNRALRAIEKATGARIAVVRNLTPDVERFNGLTFRDGTIYVDESSDRPATLVAVHEWVHQLQRDAPELYRRLEQEVRRQGDLPAWAERMRAEGNRTDESGIAEELTADAVADALTDPAFLRYLASRDVGLFRQVADSILRFLDSMLAKIKDRGTNAYLSDVQAFRDVLSGVLEEFSASPARGPDAKNDPALQRADTITVDGIERPRMNSNGQPIHDTEEGLRNFWRWFGDSKVVDAEGRPLVMYHGSRAQFEVFDFGRIGQQGRAEGAGFYFTKSQEIAAGYGTPMAVYLSVGKPLPYAAKGFSPAVLQKLVKRIAELEAQAEGMEIGDGFLANFGDVYTSGLDKVVKEAARLIATDETALDQLSGIVGSGVNPEHVNRATIEIAGVDGVVADGFVDSGDEQNLIFVAFTPEQIKSATGNSGDFSPDDARITFQRRTAAEVRFDALQGRMFTLSKLQAMGFRAGAQGWNYRANDWDDDGVRGKLKQARANLQDKFYALAEAQGDIAAAVGAVVDDAQNAYRLENLAHGRTGDRMEKLEGTILQPLSKLMRDAGLSMDVLEDYLLARHAPERNKRIAAINDDMPDGGSGITTADARAILSGAKPGVYSGKLLDKDTLATLTKAAALVDQMREQTINAMVESGSLSDAQAKALRDAFKYYVPLRGKGETDELGGTDNSRSGGAGRIDYRGPRVRRALGRGEGNLARDIVAEMVGDAQRAIVAAELAKVRGALLRLAMANPNPDAWTVAPVELEYRFSEATGEVYLAPKGQFEMAQDSLLIPLDGVTYRLKIEHPQLREALLNLGTVDTSLFTKTFGIINRWQSATMTRYNPAFVAINLIRDVGFALPTVASQHGAKTALDVLANYGPAMASTWRDVRDGKPGDASVPDAKKRMIDWAREYAEAGGRTSIMRYDDVETISKKQRRAMQTLSQLWSQGWGGKAAASAEAVKRAVGPLAEVIDAANDSVENAVRLSLYVSLRKQGWSREAAAEASKNVTVNFNRKGKWATHLNAIFLFWNAAVQGSHAVMKALSDKRVVGGLTALGALQGMFAMSMLGMDDDDDGVSLWDSIPAYRKFNAFIVPAPWSDDGYFAVPMPYGFNAFTFLGGRSVQWARDAARDERGAHASFLGDVGGGLIRSFSPVPLDQGPSGLAGNVVGIALGIAANTDDLGRPITQETYGRKVPLSTTGRYTTAEPFKVAATVLNRLGGGSDDEVPVFMPSVTDVSPDMLAHIWREATGGIGGLLSKGAASIEGVAAGRFDSVAETLANAPIASSFGIVASADRAVADRYYRQKENLELIHGRARRAVADALDANGGDQSALARDWPAVRDALGPMAAGLELVRYKRSGKRDDGSRYVAGEIQFTTLAGRRVPKLEAAEGSPMHAYKAAQDAVKEHSDAIRQAYVSDMPGAERERVMREHRTARREAQQAMLRAIRNAQRAAQ